MPFVECVPTSDGLLPKSPERIRASLESIHGSNPGIATPGTTTGVVDNTWVVVAARKKSRLSRAVHRRLIASGIEARLLDRTTDTAIVVRYEHFDRALDVIQTVGPAQQIRVNKVVDPANAVGIFLLIATVLTFFAIVLSTDEFHRDTPLALCALWIAGLAAGWLCIRRRRGR